MTFCGQTIRCFTRQERGEQMKVKLIDFGVPEDQRPVRIHGNDAGADVYMPYDCVLQPGEVAKIPLGFGLELPDGCAGYIFPRSEIHAIISNVSNRTQKLFKGSRVGQLVIMPVVIADFVSDLGEDRGKGAFGSTGK